MAEEIINRVTSSALEELNLEDYFPKQDIVVFDLKPYLFMELILKEKDFREALLNTDWSLYGSKVVAVTCSADAIIPMWAYMLVASYLQPVSDEVIFGDKNAALKQIFIRNISSVEVNQFVDKKVVVKGCGNLPVGEYAYLEITKLLRPVVKSIMYGEACSTVPIYKRK
ncbi:MAG TPA: DUF2480 family protein [Flavitalea sp.]|nr:DUF2480 family protein [Flavitalea sp.]